MPPYVPPLRNKRRGQCPDGKGLSHPKAGRPWRKTVIRPSRCLEPPRTAEAGLESSWAPGARPGGRGVEKGQWHLGPTRVRCFQDHRALLQGPHARGARPERPPRPKRLRASLTGRGSRSRPRPTPATHLSSAITIASNRSWSPAMAAGRPACGPELRHRAPGPPTREALADDPLPKRRSPLPAAAARGRPGKDGAREGPAGAGAGSGRVRGGGAGRGWAETRPRPLPLPAGSLNKPVGAIPERPPGSGQGVCPMFSVLQNRADGAELPKAAQKEPGKKLEKLLKNQCLRRLGARRLCPWDLGGKRPGRAIPGVATGRRGAEPGPPALADLHPQPGATFWDDVRPDPTKSTLTVIQGLRALIQETQADRTLGNPHLQQVTGKQPGRPN